MIRYPVVLLPNLVLSLSDSLDLVHRNAVDHQQRVAYIALRLFLPMARTAGVESDLLYAAALHDPGKVAVPNAILEKPATLNSTEFDVVRGHAYHTFRILENIGGFEEISRWAAFHHERMDGNGYPFHHGGEALPLGARILREFASNGVLDGRTRWKRSRRSTRGVARIPGAVHPPLA